MSELILYQTEDGKSEVRLRAELFATTKQNVSLHAKNILEEGELVEGATVKESLTVQIEGGRPVKRSALTYNLPKILAIGYRVRSPRGTQFRQWATAHERYENFDVNRRNVEAIAADAEDIRALEEIEKQAKGTASKQK